MANDWTCGSWLPFVRDTKGLIPNDSGVQAHTVAATLDSIDLSTELNPAGGDTLTLSGINFPTDLDQHPTQVAASDGTICDVIESSSTQIKCITNWFQAAVTTRRSLSTIDLTMSVTINSSESNQVAITVKEYTYQLLSITPSSASPILIKNLVL